MPHYAAYDLGLHCLPLSHKKHARLILFILSKTCLFIFGRKTVRNEAIYNYSCNTEEQVVEMMCLYV